MTRGAGRRLLTIAAVTLGLLGAGAIALADFDRAPQAQTPAERPQLLLLTSLPLVFPEEFSLEGGGSFALKALETRYAVQPISTTDAGSLRGGRLLLMAHPLAQPAENLVALDTWVRSGGRVLVLADPLLEWPSKLPLGDLRRPPPSFADTGLLARWGLRLEAPSGPGRQAANIGGQVIQTQSPGKLSGACHLTPDGAVARCRIGKGRVTIVADADFLNVDTREAHPEGHDNISALVAELRALER